MEYIFEMRQFLSVLEKTSVGQLTYSYSMCQPAIKIGLHENLKNGPSNNNTSNNDIITLLVTTNRQNYMENGGDQILVRK